MALILLLNKRFATTYVHAVLQLHVSDHDHRDEEIIEAYFESNLFFSLAGKNDLVVLCHLT